MSENSNENFYVEKVEGMSENFVNGVDISTIIVQENSGVKYYNEDGKEEDLLVILKNDGINYVRVRIWNNPYNNEGVGYGGGNNDVEKAIQIGQRATKLGMKLLVDFHYSDFWADPGKQTAPKEWQNYTLEEKEKAMYDFTKKSLEQMLSAGIDIGMVQIGNETTKQGIAGEPGDERYSLFRCGSKAVRDVNPNFLIVFHFTDPNQTSEILGYAESLYKHNIDYDVFATSYYPYMHGTLENLTYILKTINKNYGKKTLVAETSYAYTLDDGDGYRNILSREYTFGYFPYPVSVQGQADAIRDVMNAVVESGEGAMGIFYWEPAWIPVGTNLENNIKIWEKYGSGWATQSAIGKYDSNAKAEKFSGSAMDNQALFDFEGRALDSLKVFKYARTGYRSKS